MPRAKPKVGERHPTRDSNAEIQTKDYIPARLNNTAYYKNSSSPSDSTVNEMRQREQRGKSEVRRGMKDQAAEMSSMNSNQGWPS